MVARSFSLVYFLKKSLMLALYARVRIAVGVDGLFFPPTPRPSLESDSHFIVLYVLRGSAV